MEYKEFDTGIKCNADYSKFKFDFRLNGKRYRHTFEPATDRTAKDRQRLARVAFDEFVAEKQKEDEHDIDMSSTVDDYWNKLLALKQTAWKEYRRKRNANVYNRHIKDLLGTIKLKELKARHFTSLNLKIAHLSVRSQKEVYEMIIPVINLAIQDEIIDKSPIKDDQKPKRETNKEKKVILGANDKYKKIYKAIMEVFKDNAHHRAIFLFGFHGRRLGEIVNLRWENIDFDNNEYLVPAEISKIGMDLTFELPSDVRDALMEFRDVKGTVFNVKEVNKHYQKIRDHSGIQEFHFHWMRNLCVSALIDEGVSHGDLSSMLGHTDLSTLRKYLSLQNKSATSRTNKASSKLLKGVLD